MAMNTAKSYRVFFTTKESAAGTPETASFFEGRGEMAFGEPAYQLESDRGKIGSGEHGKKSELQAVWTPFTYKAKRLSEMLYFLSFFQGKAYSPVVSGSLQRHQIKALLKTERTLPTFTFVYYDGASMLVHSGAFVNEIEFTASSSGSGVAELTATGFCNRHQWNLTALVLNAVNSVISLTVPTSSDTLIAVEPLVNFKSMRFYKAADVTILTAPSMLYGAENLTGTPIDLTTLITAISIKGNNGLSVDAVAGAGGHGILNRFYRGDRSYNIDFTLVKESDNAVGIVSETLIQANTQFAFEAMFTGPYIAATDPYSLDFIFPVLQLTQAPENAEAPVKKAYTFEVYGDSNDVALEILAQTKIPAAYNAE